MGVKDPTPKGKIGSENKRGDEDRAKAARKVKGSRTASGKTKLAKKKLNDEKGIKKGEEVEKRQQATGGGISWGGVAYKLSITVGNGKKSP